MQIAEQKIPQLPLLLNEIPVNFLCKTMQQIENEQNDLLQHPHRHSYYSIIFIERATGIHYIDFKSYPLENNTVIFISPEQIHYLKVRGKPHGYVLLFTLDFLETNGIPLSFLSSLELFFACDEVMPVKLNGHFLAEAKDYTANIFNECKADHYLKEESLATWLKLFLITCKRAKAGVKVNNQSMVSNASNIVKQFKDLLEKHYKKYHKVTDYAGVLHFTSNYLNEVIKAQTGQSAKDFIQGRIILEAKRLATHSDLSLKEIAFDLGFDDPAHFGKFFKNCTGVDFSGFKDQIRKKYL